MGALTERQNAIAAALRAIETSGRRLTPARVVEAARDPVSPLHSLFEWHDGEAARKYRLLQARRVIVIVRLPVQLALIKVRIPYYARDPSLPPDEAGYRAVAAIKTRQDLARETLVLEAARVAAALKRMHGLAVELEMEAEFAAVSASVEAFVAAMTATGHGDARSHADA